VPITGYTSTKSSELGPLLFLIFINDLPECIKSAIPYIFADDTKCLLVVRSTSDTDKLQEDISNTADWSHFTNLLFNVAKYFHVRFLPKLPLNPDISINGNPIASSSQHKDLGITFTANLTTIK